MGELFQMGQMFSIVPHDFRNANKGEVVEVDDKVFVLRVKHPTSGILVNNLVEFYSQTPHGVLYFQADIKSIDGNQISVYNPIKHRFLQRRKFTRVKFCQDLNLVYNEEGKTVSTLDLSAGGMRFISKEMVNIDKDYDICLNLSTDQEVYCKFQPIRIEKREENNYTISGRFKNLSNVDKMTLVQFCMKKDLETVNK